MVDVTEQVIITQFGDPQRIVVTPGLHFKTPFLEEVKTFERRLLHLETPSNEFLTSDKKALVIDTYTRYRITEPLVFFENLGGEAQGGARLNQIITSELREAIGARTQKDIITKGRVPMMSQVTERSAEKARSFGVEIHDVRIKRADFPLAVATAVYARMRSERQKEANLLRAEGEREARIIRSSADVTVAETLAEANRRARQVRGRAEAQAIRALADATGRDPEFYAFLRSLEAYESALDTETTLVLSADSDLFRYLTSPQGTAGGGGETKP
jgi:membrane protease subunit HflC